jgi:hypothetical protein
MHDAPSSKSAVFSAVKADVSLGQRAEAACRPPASA